MEQYEMFNESMNENSQSHTVYFQDSYCKLPGLILLYLLAAYCILSGLILYAFKRDAAYIQASQCTFSGLMLYTFRPDSVYFQASQCILSSLIHSHTVYSILSDLMLYIFKPRAVDIQASQCMHSSLTLYTFEYNHRKSTLLRSGSAPPTAGRKLQLFKRICNQKITIFRQPPESDFSAFCRWPKNEHF